MNDKMTLMEIHETELLRLPEPPIAGLEAPEPCLYCPVAGPNLRLKTFQAFGKAWKVHLICLDCGGAFEAKSVDDAMGKLASGESMTVRYQLDQ